MRLWECSCQEANTRLNDQVETGDDYAEELQAALELSARALDSAARAWEGTSASTTWLD